MSARDNDTDTERDDNVVDAADRFTGKTPRPPKRHPVTTADPGRMSSPGLEETRQRLLKKLAEAQRMKSEKNRK